MSSHTKKAPDTHDPIRLANNMEREAWREYAHSAAPTGVAVGRVYAAPDACAYADAMLRAERERA